MADTLDIRLSGEIGGRPASGETVDFRHLSLLARAIESAAIVEGGIDVQPRRKPPRSSRAAWAAGRSSQPEPPEPIVLALVRVMLEEGVDGLPGSTYRFMIGEEAVAAVSRVTSALAGLPGGLVPRAAKAAEDGLTTAVRKGLQVQLVNGVRTPVFSQSSPPPQLKTLPTAEFHTEIAVRVIRVGGVRPAARVKLLGSGQEATVQLTSQKAARELGHHLYHDAVIGGNSEWVIDPEQFYRPTRLLRFKVDFYRLLDPVAPETTFDDIANAAGGVWDNVDLADPDQTEGHY